MSAMGHTLQGKFNYCSQKTLHRYENKNNNLKKTTLKFRQVKCSEIQDNAFMKNCKDISEACLYLSGNKDGVFHNTVERGHQLTTEGYSILPCFGYDEILHHLPLKRECLHWEREYTV